MTESDLIHSLSAQYPVERELGGGGMSRVFLAFDPSLKRRVVVKVLHPELAASVNLDRFRREIQVAANLVHPHIVALLAAGELGETPFYTMPYIEGETLRGWLQRDRRLPVSEALRIADEVAGALAYAHRQGIVHRDIKPENILLQDGRAMVSDFGIARALTQAASGGTLTQVGITVGTPAYMSPEQACGDPGLDARADIYSLGCVLYEMLAGEPPFAAASVQALIAKHLSAPAPRVRARRGEVTAAIDEVVATTLAKDPSQRFPGAAEFASAARRAATADARPAVVDESIAVLPFANLSGDASEDYLSDGITEEIIDALTKVAGLRVAARTSAFAFKGQQVDAREIASRLSVRHLLQGSVRRAGTRVRIVAQLVDADSGFQAWSEKYDREVADLFAIQDEIAGIIAKRLDAQFAAGRLPRARAMRPEAYDAYLRGRHHWHLGTPESWRKGVEWYERAIVLDPAGVDSHAGLAEVLAHLSFVGAGDGIVARAKASVARALELDPDHALAVTISGFCKCWFDWDFESALADMKRALELAPASTAAHCNMTILLGNLGEVEQAVQHGRRAVELDPLWTNAHQALQYALLISRRYPEALERAKLAVDLAPGSINALLQMSWTHIQLGDHESAALIAERLLEQVPGHPMGYGALAVAFARAGEREKSLGHIRAMEQAPLSPVTCAHLAWAYAALGDHDSAFRWIDRGIDTKDQFMGCMPAFAWWDPVRADPRFAAAMRRARFPEWSFRRTHEAIGAQRANTSLASQSAVAVRASIGIAVLPLENLGAEAADDYFADGLTDELITDLAGIRSMRVIARASMMRYKGTTKDPAAIAVELGVRYAFVGSVRRAGNSLRLTARLVDGADGSTLWSDKLGGAVEDVFAMQERLSRTIVDALKLTLSPGETHRLSERPLADVSAYEAVLQARQAMWHFSVPSLTRAASLLEQSLTRIGDNALLLGALGHVHVMFVETGDPAAPVHLAAAESCSERLRRIAPRSFEHHWLAGLLHFRRGDVREAIAEFDLARALQPSSADVACMQSYMHILAGHDDAARRAADDAIAIDPLTPLLQCMPGFCEWAAGRYDAAEPFYRRYLQLDPDNPSAKVFLLQLLANMAKRDEAAALARRLADEHPGTVHGQTGAVFALAFEGRLVEARAAFTDAMRASTVHSEVFARNLAELSALCGDVDGALDFLAHSVRLGMANHPFIAEHDRLLAPLRSHPRFTALLAEIRGRWERGGAGASDRQRLPDAVRPSGGGESIAVLPFENLSTDAENEYFADGVTEDLTSHLARIRALRVISKTSTTRYRGTTRRPDEIARELGVRKLLTGSVRRAGSRVRIVARLIEPSNGVQLWGETYDRSLDDVFAVQSDVALRIADALAANLSAEDQRRLASRPTADPAAYDLVLLGRHHWGRRNDESLRKAIGCFEGAIARDPAYAAAHAGLADTYLFAALGYASIESAGAFARAEAAARAALGLDASLAEAHTALGLIALHSKWDIALASSAFERAIVLNPNHVAAHQFLAWCRFSDGDYLGAVEVQDRALALDPLNPSVVVEGGWPFHYAGLFALALARYERAIELDPAFGLGHYNAACARHGLGRHREALEAFERAIALMGRAPWVLAWMALTHIATGETGRAEALLEEIEAQSGSGVATHLWIGMLRDALGMTETALDAIERASADHEPFVFGLSLEGWMPFVNSRQHPRFQRILRDLRLRPHDVAGQRRLLLARSR